MAVELKSREPRPEVSGPEIWEAERIDVFRVLRILARNGRLILGAVLVSGAVAAVVALLMPNVYTARTKILPPQQSKSLSTSMLSQLGPLAGLVGNMGLKNSNDTYLAMIKSQTVAEAMVNRI